jgi:carboxylesterase type B
VQTRPNATAELNCVQQVPAQTILATISNNSLAFHPIVDNLTIVDSIRTTIADGRAARVPVLIGSNEGEAQIAFSLLASQIDGEILSLTKCSETSLNLLNTILSPDTLIPNALAKAFTNYQFTCPTRAFPQYLAQNGYKVWRYYFSATFSNTNAGYSDAESYHSSELPLIFGTYPTWDLSEDEAVLSEKMQTAGENFVKNAKGGSLGLRLGTMWPQFVGGSVDKPLDFSEDDIIGIANGPDYLGVVKEASVDTACLLHPAFWKYAEAYY